MVEIVHKTVSETIDAAIALCTSENPGRYSEPKWGMKESAHINNLGLVIGFQDPTKQQYYRVDWDPEKGLHVNYQTLNGTRKVCYRVAPPVSRLGAASTVGPEQAMRDWYVNQTRRHHDGCPPEVLGKLNKGMKGRERFWNHTAWV